MLLARENFIVADKPDPLADPLQDRVSVAMEAIRKARLQIARSRTRRINTYLLRMELRDTRRRLRAEIVKAKLLASRPAA